jgi:hypothetical protein
MKQKNYKIHSFLCNTYINNEPENKNKNNIFSKKKKRENPVEFKKPVVGGWYCLFGP